GAGAQGARRDSARRARALPRRAVPCTDDRSAAVGRRRRQRRAARSARRAAEGGRHAMMRLPWFRYESPRTIAEAARLLAGEGPNAMLIAGGTDLLPNMKRRQQAPQVLVSLVRVEAMKTAANGHGLALGGGLTL